MTFFYLYVQSDFCASVLFLSIIKRHNNKDIKWKRGKGEAEMSQQHQTNNFISGSGGGSVGKAVISNTRGPRSESHLATS